MVVPVNEKTTSAIVSGKSDFQVLAVSKSSSGGSSSKSGSILNQSSSLNQSVSNQTQSEFGKKVESTQSTPLGTPKVEVNKPWYKKAGGVASDFVSSVFSPLSAGYSSLSGTETTKSGKEVQDAYFGTWKKTAKETILFGVPGVAGFTGDGKFKTAWSKDKENKVDVASGLAGVGNPLGTFQKESYSTFRDWRKEKDLTLAQQQAQQDILKKTGYNLEQEQKKLMGDFTSKDYIDMTFGKKDVKLTQKDQIDLMFGKKQASDFDPSKKESFGYQSKLVEQEINSYTKEVDSFNKQNELYSKNVEEFNNKYSGKELAKKDYNLALKDSKALESEQTLLVGLSDSLNLKRTNLESKQKNLESKYKNYENNVLGSIQDLRKAGIETSYNEKTGDLEFNSKALATKVQPAGWQWQGSLKATDGKGIAGTNVSWKNVALGGVSLVPVATEFVAVGLATGGTGTLARIGAGISKLPKVARIGTYIGLGAVATYGVAQKISVGSKYAKSNDLPGWFGATLGGATAVTEIGAFAVGGYYGSKMYFNNVGEKILAGKYTKSIAETRQGVIKYQDGTAKGGMAKQLGMYETKIKGTEWKIKTGTQIIGQYGTNEQGGVSAVKIMSQFEGKTPKGMPKSFVTKGQTLETESWIKMRAFTKSSKAKTWYSQDYLIKRTMLERLKVDVKGRPGFEGYSQLERLKMLSATKSVGKPVKVGKTIPKGLEVWKQDEIFRFAKWKGKGKVVQPWEWGEAKADSLSTTKQFVLYKDIKPKVKGDIVVNGKVAGRVYSTTESLQGFDSIAQSRGASVDLLKQALKDKVMILKDVKVSPINKRGQVSLTWQKPQLTNQVQKTITKVKPSPALQTDIALKNALRINLDKIVPGLMKQQLKQSLSGLLLVGTTGVATSQILSSRQQLKLLERQGLTTKQQSIQMQQLTQLQPQQVVTSVRQAQVPIQQIAQVPALQTISPMTLTNLPTFPGIPIIPGLPAPNLYGWGWKEPKETLHGKSSRAYIQDFTSKVLDLKPKTLSKAQLKKLLRTDLTGLEIRRGVIPK
jgi:hypothetical protein